MSRIERAWLCVAAVLLAPLAGSSQDAAPSPKKSREAVSADAPGPSGVRGSVRTKAAGEPVRLAVAMTSVHTPILVRAYDRFRALHGTDKLVLDLWVEQEWLESPRPLDFTGCDMILVLRCSIPGLDKAVAAAVKQGVWAVADSSQAALEDVVLIDDLPNLGPYFRNRGVENMIGLLERVCEAYGVEGVSLREVAEPAIEGIYHPDADRVFADADSYWKWYAARPGFKAEAPKVGIFVYNTLYLNEETDYFSQLIRGLERAGANPVLGFWFLPVGRGDVSTPSPMNRFFAGVDVLLTSSFRLMQEQSQHAQELQRLDVPVLNSIILNEPREQWRQSGQGIAASYLLPGIVTPEFAGLIEPTVIAARQPVENEATGLRYYRTVVIEENYQWQIRRAMAWARLRRTAAAERRVAILFYNHSGGKQNVGASYLNVTASLERILEDLSRREYRVDGGIDRQSIIDSMLAVGRNIGTWAPAELEALVQKGAVLWPLEKYLAHYDRLPEEARRQISRQWGQPPGEVMTVTRDGRQYFVLPVFQRGNILLAPQPARAASDKQTSLYHDPLVWPTHQYLAFYLWLQHEWNAAAVVHLGRHGTLEFLPGKGVGIAPHDPPALVIGDLPHIYPYIVDGIGEGVAAKRRGQAVLLTHATPPLTGTELYGDLAKLRETVNRYTEAREQKQSGLQAEYVQSILAQAAALGYQAAGQDQGEEGRGASQPGPPGGQPLSEDETVHRIEHWLETIGMQTGPRGLHSFGTAYSPEDTRDMLPRMFRDELEQLRASGWSGDDQRTWLDAAAAADSPSPPAPADGAEPAKRKPAGKPADAAAVKPDPAQIRARIEATAWEMRHNQELEALARALDGRFLPAGPPGDPLSNPDIFPTGRNQYQYNPAKLPTREAWAVGQRMAQQTLEMHRSRHGAEANKLSVTLWANTLIRTHGALESEVLYLLGVEPVWDQRGDVTDVRLVTPLGRPRVDVVMSITSMYRDSFPDKVLLLDKAVRLANDAPAEAGQANYIQANTERLARELAGRGASPEDSRSLALLRIFGAQTGQYGTGVDGAVKASESWTQRSEVADEYLQRMSFGFSAEGWSQPAQEIFRRQLRGVQAVIHGRSSNLYGIMDLTEVFEYQGGLALAVEQLDGKQPDLYVNDLIRGQQVHSAREVVVFELLSRYHNPDFIRAMQAEGYDGARYFSRIADNQFGWDVVSDAITAEDWKAFAEIYLEDKHQLGLREFFDRHNPHALQNIASRVLETDRKGLQKLDARTLELAARVYVETVAQHGPACTSHICANPELAKMAERLAGASEQLAEGTLERFRRQLLRTGNAEFAKAGGASDEPAQGPQNVAGQVIAAPPPPPSAGPPEPASSPLPKPAVAAPVRPQSPASDAAPRPGWIVTLLAGIACLAAFVFGIVRRAKRNRPSEWRPT